MFCFTLIIMRQINIFLRPLNLKNLLKKEMLFFKMNCFGCYGITARGLVGLDLNSIIKRLNDKEIIKQVTGGLIPSDPSFEIEPQNMSNLLKFLYSLE